MTDRAGQGGGGNPSPQIALQTMVAKSLRPAIDTLASASAVDPSHAMTISTLVSDLFKYTAILSRSETHRQLSSSTRESLFSAFATNFPEHFLSSIGRFVPSPDNVHALVAQSVQAETAKLDAKLDHFMDTMTSQFSSIADKMQDHQMGGPPSRPTSPPNPDFSDEVLAKLISIESAIAGKPFSSGPPALPEVVATRLAALERAVTNRPLPAGARPQPSNSSRPLPSTPQPPTNSNAGKGKPSTTPYLDAASTTAPSAPKGKTNKNQPSADGTDIPNNNTPNQRNKPTPTLVSFIVRYGRFSVPQHQRPNPFDLTKLVNAYCKTQSSLLGLSALSVRFIASGNIRLDFPPDTNPQSVLSHSAGITALFPHPDKITFSQLLPISKLILHNVPTSIGLDSHRPTQQELRAELLRNPVFSSIPLWSDPDWVRKPDTISSLRSAIVIPIQDFDGSKAMSLLRQKFFLFGEPAYPRAWHDRPLLRICPNCLRTGHLAHQCNARSSRCKHCGQEGHTVQDHVKHCPLCIQSGESNKCSHPMHCFRCGGEHAADDLACPSLVAFTRPSAQRSSST